MASMAVPSPLNERSWSPRPGVLEACGRLELGLWPSLDGDEVHDDASK